MRLFRRKEKKETIPPEEPVKVLQEQPLDTVSFRDAVLETLGIVPRADAALVKPLELAYIGDTVYEAMNRLIAVSGPDRALQEIHRECSDRARAETQAKLAEALQENFTEEEMKIYLRARNAHVGTRKRSASIGDYHKATGLEAVFGYLYLSGRYERIAFLMKEGAGKAGVNLG